MMLIFRCWYWIMVKWSNGMIFACHARDAGSIPVLTSEGMCNGNTIGSMSLLCYTLASRTSKVDKTHVESARDDKKTIARVA